MWRVLVCLLCCLCEYLRPRSGRHADRSSREHHEALVRSLYRSFKSSFLGSFAAEHKLLGIQGGNVSRSGWLERLVWKSIRQRPLGGIAGDNLRAVVVVGGKSSPDVDSQSLMISNVQTHRQVLLCPSHTSFSLSQSAGYATHPSPPGRSSRPTSSTYNALCPRPSSWTSAAHNLIQGLPRVMSKSCSKDLQSRNRSLRIKSSRGRYLFAVQQYWIA